MTVIPEGIPAIYDGEASEAWRHSMAQKDDLIGKAIIVWIALEVVHIMLSVWIAENWK